MPLLSFKSGPLSDFKLNVFLDSHLFSCLLQLVRPAMTPDVGIEFSSLLQYDTNVAKRAMEELRKALRWEQVPVVTDFDPRFNQRRPLFFERLYQPFLPQQNKQDFEDIQDK